MWPRRQGKAAGGKRGDKHAAATAPAARAAPLGAPPPASASRTALGAPAPAPAFAARRGAAKPANAKVKAAAPTDDAAWLLRAYDKKKARTKIKLASTARKVVSKPKTIVKKATPSSKPAKTVTASGKECSKSILSWRERQQRWKSGATTKQEDENAIRAKQKEIEAREAGFDRVFQQVFAPLEDATTTESSGALGASSLGLTTFSTAADGSNAIDNDTEASVLYMSTASAKKRSTPSSDGAQEEKEAWGFGSSPSALCLDDFDAPPDSASSNMLDSATANGAKTAEFARWKAEQMQSAVSDNYVRLNMRKRVRGSSGRAKKRPAYLRSRRENPLDEVTGDSAATGLAPLVDASGSQQRRTAKPLLADDGVDFIEECLEAVSKAEAAHKASKDKKSIHESENEDKPAVPGPPLDPPRCHHALVCQELVVKKKNQNHGRKFFTCPLGMDEGRCDFFLWVEDHTPLALQTLFSAPASSSSDTQSSAAQAGGVDYVPLDLEASEEDQLEALRTNLRLVFGHADFRAGQQWAISRVLRRQDTLLVLPTGAGKSLCYQFPALFLPGVTLVISPLISLMNDQFESLPAPLKARAVCLSGSSGSGSASKAKHASFVRDLLADKLSLVFLSPEKALGAGMQSLLALPRVRARLALVCVDEAHCVSEWSHHFRPSYLRLAEVFRHAQCVLCVTATASRRVVHDVLRQLRSRRESERPKDDQETPQAEADMVLQMPWQRRNLALEVRAVSSNDERLRHLTQVLPELSRGGTNGTGGGVIVYVHQQRQTEELAALLREQLPPAWRGAGKIQAFHAGMGPEAKEKVRSGFSRGRVRVVVATVAFGMGIDKKNVRAVVHFHAPASVEGYVQQVGRAGRDGKPAKALLYLLQEDAVHFRSLLFSTALDREQLRQLLTLVFRGSEASDHGVKDHVVAVDCPGRAGERALTLVSLERDWLEHRVDLKAATIETFLTLLSLGTQELENEDDELRVKVQPLSMSRCSLTLLESQARKLPPRSCVRLVLEAAQLGKEIRHARAARHKDGYLSSWTVEFHLHEMARWYARISNTSTSQPTVTAPEAPTDEALSATMAATVERRLLQELRKSQQDGHIQRFSLSHPAFQIQLICRSQSRSSDARAAATEHWTRVLYAKHERLEALQVSRLAHLHGALHAAALPPATAATDSDEDEQAREKKARVLEDKLVHYFDDAEGRDDDDERLMQQLLRPLTPMLTEAIERDTRALIQLPLGDEPSEDSTADGEQHQWTSFSVAKVFHGLTTPLLPTKRWHDHVCWRRYSDVAFESVVKVAHRVLQQRKQEDEQAEEAK